MLHPYVQVWMVVMSLMSVVAVAQMMLWVVVVVLWVIVAPFSSAATLPQQINKRCHYLVPIHLVKTFSPNTTSLITPKLLV